MAHLKTAIKRLQTSKKANLRNRARTSELKTFEKKFRAAVAEGNKAEAEVAYRNAVSVLDKAASKGIIHANAAARKKSRFTQKLNTL